MSNVIAPPIEAPTTAAERYINRELSWLAFNERVLDQASDPRHPLLERVRFLAIFSNNLNEFFMVRVGGLTALLLESIPSLSTDGRTPREQLQAISQRLDPLLEKRIHLWEEVLQPELAAEGVHLSRYEELDEAACQYLEDYFDRELFPLLTPLAVDPGRPFPHISNLSMNLAIQLEVSPGNIRFARLKMPTLVPRLVPIPTPADAVNPTGRHPYRFVWLHQVIRAHLSKLFPGVKILSAHAFRIIRDADQPLAESEVSDLMMAMEDHLRRRYFGRVVRIEVEPEMPEEVRDLLLQNLEATPQTMDVLPSPLEFGALFELVSFVERPALKYPLFTPVTPPFFSDREERSLFEVLQERDRLLHHPYESFEPVVRFIESAAQDPQVVAIKQTLYRVGNNSPVVQALLDAQREGKQVTVLVELKARFDEENNIEWAKALEDEGVHVVYGLPGLKTHCKLTLVIRRERLGLRGYVHVGTGNYNAGTARLYTDMGLFTTNADVVHDAANLFNFLTGFSNQREYKALLVAPISAREGLGERIEREIEHARQGRPAHLYFKMNSLTDRQMTDLLYEASGAGVNIRLLIRGACCLRPGVPGLSENIEVRSIIGRFLEHSRIYYFGNGGKPEIIIGSADYMSRNLDRRVEALVPIMDARQREALHDRVLEGYWADTCNSYRLLADGTYVPLSNESPTLDSHAYFLALYQEQEPPKQGKGKPPKPDLTRKQAKDRKRKGKK